ncbi:hypothetical protein [Pseudomonas aeruginosa]|uniref:hypothetical protein n=1 Tax=Pseudomonas aeruginosa TaxID=287 RepID=UPI0025764E06|nr:hypothetical protein [Pseudomonas aeruginosa]MDM1441629.1 hypothetical protein [Pseudomonas aeruginosa]
MTNNDDLDDLEERLDDLTLIEKIKTSQEIKIEDSPIIEKVDKTEQLPKDWKYAHGHPKRANNRKFF